MAITTSIPVGFKFEEVAGNNGAIANSLTLKITDGTFAGDNGDVVQAAVSNLPAGLEAFLLKTSATTARLILTGTATTHTNAQNVTDLTVTFEAASFATGVGVPAAITNLKINFNDPAAAKALALVAPAGAGTSETYKAANLPTIKGTAPDGVAKVYIYNNGGTKPIGEATVTANAWEFKLPTEKLKDGAYSLTASASNDGKGAMTAGFAFTVDTKAPAAPSVNAIKGAISDTTPILTGKAEKGAMVEVFADEAQTKSLGVTTADAKGVWTLAVDNTVLVDNLKTDPTTVYKITAKATDAAGNETKTKKAVDLIIDTTIATPTLEATTVAKKNTVALSGKVDGETGGSLQLYGGEDGSLALGKAIKIGKDGTWKSSVKLTDGKHLLSVVAIDAAGNMSDNSVLDAADIVTIDTFTATPTVELVKTGEVLTGLKGTAEANAKVKITIGTAKDKFTATADASGNWEVTDVSAFTVTKEAKLKITAIATDAATNVSKASTAVEHTFKVGGAADAAPTISAFTVTDGTTLSITSSEAGTAGLYNDTGNVLITGTDGAVTATTPKAITVAAQASMTTASLKVSDGATPVNTTTSPIKVLLGTAGGDGGADFTVGAGDQYIFTFAGNDTVTLTSAAASGRVIADFTAGDDKIALTGTAFVGIADSGGLLQAADFSSGAGKVAAANATEFIIYDTNTGNLYYDAGGNAGAAAVLIAKLVGSPDTLAATDFLVV